jgi:anthranilate synthase/aminodeoxychorismate synthase-like glutamine amidotransferase
MLLLLDNYDSFTYNLYDYLLQLHENVIVYRNDEVTIEEITALKPKGIVISPGPKTPEDAGITLKVIKHFHYNIPILGICLGHQALGVFFGAELLQADYPMHGKTSLIQHNNDTLFQNIPNPFQAMRYHSLYLDKLAHTPLQIIAATVNDNIPMAIKHKSLPLYGLQFHPESILTPDGLTMLNNWLQINNLSK